MGLLDDVATWSAPCAGQNPCGAQARGEEAYEQIRMEIAKLGAVSGDGPAWDRVSQLSADLLVNKSKDLVIASYLAVALLEREGGPGLVAGLTLYRNLVASYWPDLFPELARVRGRIGAISWLSEQSTRALGKLNGGPAQAEVLAAADPILGELDKLLGEKLGEAHPGFGGLKHALREARGRTEAPVSTRAAESTAKGASAGDLGEMATPRDAQRALRMISGELSRVAAFRRGAKLSDPSAFRLRRLGEWLEVMALPPDTDGKTQIALPRALKEQIEALKEASNWEGLVAAAEKGLKGDAIFWLDLQAELASALSQLGSEFVGARKAVCEELRSVLGRLPGLDRLAFEDGTPFASERTRTWIGRDVLVGGGAAVAAPSHVKWVLPDGTSAQKMAELETAFQSALKEAREGRLKEGLGMLAAKLREAETRRDKFLWRFATARVLLECDRPEVAKAQLEALDEELSRTTVSDWDIPLGVDVLCALLECQQKSGKGKDGSEPLRALYERIAKLDPTVAIGVKIRL